jgi:uncharacterized repeat protein (TIGR03803 family)
MESNHMENYFRNLSLLGLSVIAGTGPLPAAAPTYRAVYYETDQTGEAVGIVEVSPGVFYSATGSTMAIFSVGTQGLETTLATFLDPPYILGSSPGATGANGLFYSSVSEVEGVGSGNIFSVSSAVGSEQIYPAQRLAALPLSGNLPNGILFGVLYDFSNGSRNLGTVALSGKATAFYEFPSGDRPATPIYGADGNYYGISYNAGVAGSTSYFYRVTPSGSFTNIASLPFIGAGPGDGGGSPYAGSGLILQGADGNFYGIQPTTGGCSASNQHGAVFKLTPTGQFTILHDFGVCENSVVNSLIEGSDGKLYGVTEGNSVIFSLTTSGTYKALFAPSNGNMQGLCTCTLVQGSDGVIYGTALGGGPSGLGLIFSLSVGLPIPKPRGQQFSPQSGAVGTQVRIWGYNLFGASVEFDGVPATGVYNAGPNYVWATVPTGAATGPITITTPGGAVTTRESFTVE